MADPDRHGGDPSDAAVGHGADAQQGHLRTGQADDQGRPAPADPMIISIISVH